MTTFRLHSWIGCACVGISAVLSCLSWQETRVSSVLWHGGDGGASRNIQVDDVILRQQVRFDPPSPWNGMRLVELCATRSLTNREMDTVVEWTGVLSAAEPTVDGLPHFS